MAPPVSVTLSTGDLDTPALLLDLDALDANIGHISQTCRKHGIHWRPHIKGQKIPALAHRQVAAGALGVTCAKLGEAEVMADAGIRDILIANQIVGSLKIRRLAELAGRSRVIVAIDSPDNLQAIAAAARAEAVSIRMVVEVDIGMKRAGVAPGTPALALARQCADTAGVVFEGFAAWEGHTASIVDPVAKLRAVTEAVGSLTATAAQCRASGLPVAIVSCGGTGTYPITAAIQGVTEIQTGGGIFGDLCCREKWHVDLRSALTMLTTVTSRPTPSRIVCDAGKKSLSSDMVVPRPLGIAHVESMRLSAEHGIIELSEPDNSVRIGDRIVLEVGYADTTIHLHEELYAMRGSTIASIWPVAARGKSR